MKEENKNNKNICFTNFQKKCNNFFFKQEEEEEKIENTNEPLNSNSNQKLFVKIRNNRTIKNEKKENRNKNELRIIRRKSYKTNRNNLRYCNLENAQNSKESNINEENFNINNNNNTNKEIIQTANSESKTTFSNSKNKNIPNNNNNFEEQKNNEIFENIPKKGVPEYFEEIKRIRKNKQKLMTDRNFNTNINQFNRTTRRKKENFQKTKSDFILSNLSNTNNNNIDSNNSNLNKINNTNIDIHSHSRLSSLKINGLISFLNEANINKNNNNTIINNKKNLSNKIVNEKSLFNTMHTNNINNNNYYCNNNNYVNNKKLKKDISDINYNNNNNYIYNKTKTNFHKINHMKEELIKNIDYDSNNNSRACLFSNNNKKAKMQKMNSYYNIDSKYYISCIDGKAIINGVRTKTKTERNINLYINKNEYNKCHEYKNDNIISIKRNYSFNINKYDFPNNKTSKEIYKIKSNMDDIKFDFRVKKRIDYLSKDSYNDLLIRIDDELFKRSKNY